MISSTPSPLTVDIPKLLEDYGEQLIERLLRSPELTSSARTAVRQLHRQYAIEVERLANRGRRASNTEYNQWISDIFESVNQGVGRDELIDDFVNQIEGLIAQGKSDAIFALVIEQVSDGQTALGYRLRQHCGKIHANQWENFESSVSEIDRSQFLDRMCASEETVPLALANSIEGYDGLFDGFVRSVFRQQGEAPDQDIATHYWLAALSLLSQSDAEPRRILYLAYRNVGTSLIPNPGRGAGMETRMLDILRIAYGQIDHQALVLNQHLAQQRQEWIRSLAPSVYAHDFVAPLSAIRNHCQTSQLFMLDLVPSIAEEGTPDQQNRLATALDALADLTSAAANLYQVAAAYASLETISDSGVWSLNQVLDTALGLTKSRCSTLGVAVEAPKRATAIRLKVDQAMVMVVLVNILQNALNAIEQERKPMGDSAPLGASTIVIAMRVLLAPRLEILIANTGPAVPLELRARIFKKGFTTYSGVGHGMGLYLCRQICALLGASLELLAPSELQTWELKKPCNVGFVLNLPLAPKISKTQAKVGAVPKKPRKRRAVISTLVGD